MKVPALWTQLYSVAMHLCFVKARKFTFISERTKLQRIYRDR